jgi:hypothetical protein
MSLICSPFVIRDSFSDLRLHAELMRKRCGWDAGFDFGSGTDMAALAMINYTSFDQNHP